MLLVFPLESIVRSLFFIACNKLESFFFFWASDRILGKMSSMMGISSGFLSSPDFFKAFSINALHFSSSRPLFRIYSGFCPTASAIPYQSGPILWLDVSPWKALPDEGDEWVDMFGHKGAPSSRYRSRIKRTSGRPDSAFQKISLSFSPFLVPLQQSSRSVTYSFWWYGCNLIRWEIPQHPRPRYHMCDASILSFLSAFRFTCFAPSTTDTAAVLSRSVLSEAIR